MGLHIIVCIIFHHNPIKPILKLTYLQVNGFRIMKNINPHPLNCSANSNFYVSDVDLDNSLLYATIRIPTKQPKELICQKILQSIG